MTSVLIRIQRKIDVLQEWVDHGIPVVTGDAEAKVFPTSLNKARLWEDSELGVEKIADPGSFTKNHPRHGSKVIELEQLIKRFRAIQARPKRKGKSVSDQLLSLRQEHVDLQKRHQKVVSQLSCALEELELERSQRLAVEKVLSEFRRRERIATERLGRNPLSLVPTDPSE